MIHNFIFQWPNINLRKIYDLRDVKGDTIVYNITIYGINLTGWQIRGELYDLNTGIRMASELVPGAGSNPDIIITHADDTYSSFTATVHHTATAMFQQYGQLEFDILDPNDAKYTILQQPVLFYNERVIWDNKEQPVVEDPGVNPLF